VNWIVVSPFQNNLGRIREDKEIFSRPNPRIYGDFRWLREIHQKTSSKNIDVNFEIVRVAPAAATGRDRETLDRARLDDSSSAGLPSLPVQSSLKVWVSQILPPWRVGVLFRKRAPRP
jgi:hypothetical protein